jgi:hypothetical protein
MLGHGSSEDGLDGVFGPGQRLRGTSTEVPLIVPA